MGKLRADTSGSNDGQSVHLYQGASTASLVLQRRRLKCVLVVLDGVARHGISLARSLELGAPWGAVVGGWFLWPSLWR